jgi:hypothetical protein
MYKKEFKIESNGNTTYNDSFWDGQKEFRTMKDNHKMVFMDTCVTIPEFVLKTSQLASHRSAVTWMSEHGCGVGGAFHKFILYKGYVGVLLHFLTSPSVKQARIYGFHPLFIMKNCLLAKSTFGVRGISFVTCDKSAKTSILLVGFWRMKHSNPDNLELVGLSVNGSMLTHPAVFD